MAENKDKDNVFEIYFPFRGLNEVMSYKDQLPLTTPLMANCRIADVSEGRARGGMRPGLKKAFSEQVGADAPVLKMLTCINTYIPAEE